LDGICDQDDDRLMFRFVSPPLHDDLQDVTDEIARRVMRMLARQGLRGEARCNETITSPGC
jgi:hypothetical protein